VIIAMPSLLRGDKAANGLKVSGGRQQVAAHLGRLRAYMDMLKLDGGHKYSVQV
jgi:hypothetical protein